MDSFSQVMSQCHLGTANDMDSPAAANFYDCEEKPFTVKQEQFEDIEDSNVRFGAFLNDEDFFETYAPLGDIDTPNQVETTGDGILRQLGEHFASKQMLTQTPAPTPAAQPNQQPVHYYSYETTNETTNETISNMPQQNTQPQTHVMHQSMADNQFMEIHSTSTSAASSPGLPTSCDAFNEQPQEVQIQAHSSSPGTGNATSTASGGGGSQKRKRPVPAPGTDEYKQKRERNNIAVRKSREKTKLKNRELQDKVGELQSENAALKKRVEGLTRELTVLRSLFTTTGKNPPAALEKAVK